MGRRFARYLRAGPRTYLGLQIAALPNLFTITGPGASVLLLHAGSDQAARRLYYRLHCPQAGSGFLADRGNARSCGSGVEHINAPAYRMKTRGSPGTWAPRHQECLDCGGSVAFAVSDMTRLAADDSERVLWVEPSRFGHG